MSKKENLITIIVQGFYGNRTLTEVKKENIEGFLLGNTDGTILEKDKIDKTIIPILDGEFAVVYNKYMENICTDRGFKVLFKAPGIELRSRCFVCRYDGGELASLQKDDVKEFIEYLSK